MKTPLIVALAMFCIAINTTAQPNYIGQLPNGQYTWHIFDSVSVPDFNYAFALSDTNGQVPFDASICRELSTNLIIPFYLNINTMMWYMPNLAPKVLTTPFKIADTISNLQYQVRRFNNANQTTCGYRFYFNSPSNTHKIRYRKGHWQWQEIVFTGNQVTLEFDKDEVYCVQVRVRNSATLQGAYSLPLIIQTPAYLNFEQFGNSEQLAYPNPASDVVKFNGKIVVQDLFGRIVATGENEVDVQHLANGLYIVNGKKHIIKH